MKTAHALTIGRITGFLERIEELRTGGAVRSERARGRAEAQQSPPAAAPDATGGDGGTAASSASSPFGMLGSFLSPVLSPIATLGIVLVIALFILLQQDDFPEGFIRLVGARDLHRTTVALNEAVRRLSKYFLVQLALLARFVGKAPVIGAFVGHDRRRISACGGTTSSRHEPSYARGDQGHRERIRLHLIAQIAHELGAAMAARIGYRLVDELARRHPAAQLLQRQRDLRAVRLRLCFENLGWSASNVTSPGYEQRPRHSAAARLSYGG